MILENSTYSTQPSPTTDGAFLCKLDAIYPVLPNAFQFKIQHL